jgi:hypothetical protein
MSNERYCGFNSRFIWVRDYNKQLSTIDEAAKEELALLKTDTKPEVIRVFVLRWFLFARY